MSHIDFAIGFILIVSTIAVLFYMITNSISNSINDFSSNEIRESSFSLERYLFYINDEKSLISTYKELQAVLTETNSTYHTEEIRISIKPEVSKVKVYDNSMSEIISSPSSLPGETIVSFTIEFAPNDVKRINIFYFGDSVNRIDYLTPDNNITFRIISDKGIDIVSQEKCLNLYPYDTFKEIIGFKGDFRLDLENCNYGPQPSVGNIVTRNIPIIFASADGSLSMKFARLSVW